MSYAILLVLLIVFGLLGWSRSVAYFIPFGLAGLLLCMNIEGAIADRRARRNLPK